MASPSRCWFEMQDNKATKSRHSLHGTIMCNADTVNIDHLSRNIRWLVKAFPDSECFKFVVYIGHYQRWWERVFPVAEALMRAVRFTNRRETENVAKRLSITVHGKFSGDLPSDSVSETLVRHGIFISYDTDRSLGLATEDRSVVKALVNFGFRLPATVYITKKSEAIDDLLKTCENLLSENQYSGLSVLPICSHPEFSEEYIDLIPDVDRYLEALLCAYELFPFYDDVFMPVADVLSHVVRNRNEKEDVTEVCVLVQGDGTVRKFKKLPFLAREAATLKSLSDVDERISLRQKLFQDAGSTAGLLQRCKNCHKLKLCGGTELRAMSDTEKAGEIVCGQWLVLSDILEREITQVNKHVRRSRGADCDMRRIVPKALFPILKRHRSKHRKGLNLASIPAAKNVVQSIDLDITQKCNLRCSYCFKEKKNKDASVQVCKDAITWLIYASGNIKEVNVTMIGGEPLLRFDTMKQIVPFGIRRALQHGKKLRFGMTTNCTLFTKEIQNFCRRWNIGLHTSIDGLPAVQDAHRVFAGGRGSSQQVEQAIPLILQVHPIATARSTILPDTVEQMYNSYKYFLHLGYERVALVPGNSPDWNSRKIAEFERQFALIGDDCIEKCRNGEYVNIKFIHDWLEEMGRRDRIVKAGGSIAVRKAEGACGAGRGMMLIDVDGGIWPCHRWNSAKNVSWQLGYLYSGEFRENCRAKFFDMQRKNKFERRLQCADCLARPICRGGCPGENLDWTGDIFDCHPSYCELHKRFAGVAKRVHDTLLREENSVLLERHYGEAPKEAACCVDDLK